MMINRSRTAIIVALCDPALFSEWMNRSWQNLSRAHLVVVPFGDRKNDICSIAPNASICPDGEDTTLEGNRNRALDFLKGSNFEFVAFLDDDTFVDRDWIDEMLKAAETFPKVAAFASVVRTDGSNQIQGCGHVFLKAAPLDASENQEPICPCGNSSLVRLSAIERIKSMIRRFGIRDSTNGRRVLILG